MRSGSEWLRVLLSTAFVLTCGCGAEQAAGPVAVEPPARAAGSLRVEVSGSGVDVEAHDALALEVLDRLAQQARFSVVTRAAVPHNVSLRLEKATLEAAIAAILAGLPYALDYRYDAARGSHAIDTVRVGAEPVSVAAPNAAPATERPAIEASEPELEVVDLDRLLAERVARDPDADTEPELLAALADSREDVRAEAVGDLGTTEADLQTAIAFSKADPSPVVRAAAVDALGSDGRYAALSAVIAALDDRDPTVVLRAVAVIEEQGDASLAARLEPLTGHANTEVRTHAAAALEQLQ